MHNAVMLFVTTAGPSVTPTVTPSLSITPVPQPSVTASVTSQRYEPSFSEGSCIMGYLSFGPIEKYVMIFATLLAREGLGQPRAWSEGDVSTEHCLQGEAGELAGVIRARQARPLSACTTY